ncbi:MAG: S1 RNA-binding domain-containing protein [Chloroflexi bacterium]|nr:S1 RNA-binding domain-containing protein [Chloroflexota bacterium]MCC6892007.1 S1 RNA-binding domain-containing protein [Anaerolineae bacterium]
MSEETATSVPTTVGELQPKMELKGTVKRLELYGAFVDIGVGQDALLHISQLGKPNVRNVGDIVKEGDEVTVYVLKIHADTGRVAISLVKPPDFTWDDLKEGQTVSGKVVRMENFGLFVDIGAERPAMIHVSELSDNFVNSPSDIAKVGDTVAARVLRVNSKKRQIDLTMKTEVEPAPVIEDVPEEAVPTAMELALRGAMDDKKGGRDRRENKERERREKMSRERDDIIARTLRSHS